MSRKSRVIYSPTQQDIKKACEEIRETWTKREYQKRSCESNQPYTVQRIDLSDFVELVRESRRRDYD
ncbi:MAG: hypothetical protein WC867_08220 [Candidatus Pacearchaeota archaeon]|jgi:hypothetical protein